MNTPIVEPRFDFDSTPLEFPVSVSALLDNLRRPFAAWLSYESYVAEIVAAEAARFARAA